MILSSVLAAGLTIATCPSEITDKQELVTKESGWSHRVMKGSRQLTQVSVFIGSVADSAEIHPTRIGDGEVSWILAPDVDHTMECRYENSAVVIEVRIGKPESCSFRRVSSDRRRASVECR